MSSDNTSMVPIECDIQVHWRHRVLFTDAAFGSGNPLLRDLLNQGELAEQSKVLVVLDAALAAARPALAKEIKRYFHVHPSAGRLVRAPLILQGGEQLK